MRLPHLGLHFFQGRKKSKLVQRLLCSRAKVNAESPKRLLKRPRFPFANRRGREARGIAPIAPRRWKSPAPMHFPSRTQQRRGSPFAGWCSHYNFHNGVGVKNSPMPRLQFTKRFVIVQNPDFRAPVVREFDILGTPNPKLVARKRDHLERFERVRLGQFSQLGLYAQTLENSVRQFAITFLGLIGSNSII
jgi:hypothetical protein